MVKFTDILLRKVFLKVKYESLKENKPLDLFLCEKIFGRQLVNRKFRLQFSFFNESAAFKKNLYAIYNLKKEFHYYYLLAILNSAFFSYIQVNLNSSGQRDDYPAFSLQDYRNFLIPDLSQNDQKSYINIVSKILLHTQSNDYIQNKSKQHIVKEYDKQIDKMVYEIYGLSKEEIKIIEELN